MNKEMWTIGKILKWTEEYFSKYNIETPRLDAEVLLGHVLKKERIYLYVHFDQPLVEAELAEYRACVLKRAKHMPIAYIVGHKEFMGLDFLVNEKTLIPRPDTEILVEETIKRLKKIGSSNSTVLDIGTGSGAICISLLKNIDNLHAFTVDISEDALAIAGENAKILEVSDRVELLVGDMFQPIESGKNFTAIVSNPPYIPSSDIKTLQADVKGFEPLVALDGGFDGLDFYRTIVSNAGKYLADGGFLALEIGINQREELQKIAERSLIWQDAEVIKDLAGIERCLIFWKKAN